MEEKISERISQLVATFGKGRNTLFADLIGDSEANIRNYRTGRSTPKFAVLLNIIKKCGVNPEWLMSGEGPMTSDGSPMPSPSPKPKRRPAFPPSIGAQYDENAFSMRLPDFDELEGSEPSDDEPVRSAPRTSDRYDANKLKSNDSVAQEACGVRAKNGDDRSKDEIAKLRADLATCFNYISNLSSLVAKLNKEVRSLNRQVELIELARAKDKAKEAQKWLDDEQKELERPKDEK